MNWEIEKLRIKCIGAIKEADIILEFVRKEMSEKTAYKASEIDLIIPAITSYLAALELNQKAGTK